MTETITCIYTHIHIFLGRHLRHMEGPRLGVESELQLPACTTATAMLDLSCVCNLHHSSQRPRIANPLSKARDRTCVFMDASLVLNPLSHNGNSKTHNFGNHFRIIRSQDALQNQPVLTTEINSLYFGLFLCLQKHQRFRWGGGRRCDGCFYLFYIVPI